MKFMEELRNAILDEDFYGTNEILEKIRMQDNAFEYLSSLFEVFENNPDTDYGMPGPVTHFMESFYKKGYEKLLLESVQRCPTCQTIWMVNRIINDPSLKEKAPYINALKDISNRTDISLELKKEVDQFLSYQKSL